MGSRMMQRPCPAECSSGMVFGCCGRLEMGECCCAPEAMTCSKCGGVGTVPALTVRKSSSGWWTVKTTRGSAQSRKLPAALWLYLTRVVLTSGEGW
jgi:hypothetical protein